jgi:hypothetical protein
MSRAAKDLSTGGAEDLAVAGLIFLAGDAERLEPFLSLTGLTPETLRAAAGDPGFLRAVLEHIATDDSLLLAFAANEQRQPDEILRALKRLGGGTPDWEP